MEIVTQLTINSLIASSIYALLAMGFNLIYGTVRFFDMGFGAMTAVGGYFVFWLFKMLGVPLYVALPAGVLFSGFIGLLVFMFVYVPLRRRNASNMVLLVAAFGVLTAIQAVIAILFTSQFQTLSKGSASVINIGSGVVTDIQLAIFASAIAVFGALSLVLYKTSLGKSIRAIGDDEEVAKIVGIDTRKVIAIVFFIGSAIAGLAGALVGFDTGIEPTMGLTLLLKGVIAAIIGGVGNVFGGVAGAFLLGFIENYGIWYISGEWKDSIAFAVLILFLLFKPKGILGR